MNRSLILSKDSIKSLAYFLGKLLGILGVGFVFYKISQEYTLESFMEKFEQLFHIVLPLLMLNIISMMLGILVWHKMLLHYSKVTFPYGVSYYFFAKTEIAKYLPGNIFHFLGRQLLATKLHLSQTQMAKISGMFTLFLLIGTLFSGTLFLIFSEGMEIRYRVLLVVLVLLSLGVTLSLYPSFAKITKIKMDGVLTISIGMQGTMMGIIIFTQLESMQVGVFFQVVGIYIFSWLVGFVTPGASGGIGVREGAFITMAEFLQLGISSEIVLFSVLFIRLINVATDILAYSSTYILQDEKYIK